MTTSIIYGDFVTFDDGITTLFPNIMLERPMLDTIARFQQDGFETHNLYADGVVRMERKLSNGDTLYTFINSDGSYKPVKVWEAELERITAEIANQ